MSVNILTNVCSGIFPQCFWVSLLCEGEPTVFFSWEVQTRQQQMKTRLNRRGRRSSSSSERSSERSRRSSSSERSRRRRRRRGRKKSPERSAPVNTAPWANSRRGLSGTWRGALPVATDSKAKASPMATTPSERYKTSLLPHFATSYVRYFSHSSHLKSDRCHCCQERTPCFVIFFN